MEKEGKKREWRKGLFALLRPAIRLVARVFFGASTEVYRRLKGPYLVLANHTTFADAMLLGVAFREPLHIVASSATMNSKAAGRLVRALADPIVIKRTAMDLQAIRRLFAEAKEGHSIGLFPEGTITIDGSPAHIDIAVAKLAKQLKMPIVLYRVEGGYYRKPKWARHRRRNRVYGKIVEIIRPDEAKAMPLDALYERIVSAIAYNPFAQPFDIPTPPAKRLAEGVERLLYYCPECQGKGDFRTKGNTFRCAQCGAQYTIDEQCHIDAGLPNTAAWNQWQTRLAEERAEAEDFAVEGELWDIMQHAVVDKGVLAAGPDGVTIGERTLPYTRLEGVALYAYNQVLLTADDIDYRFKPTAESANVMTLIAAIQYHMTQSDDK